MRCRGSEHWTLFCGTRASLTRLYYLTLNLSRFLDFITFFPANFMRDTVLLWENFNDIRLSETSGARAPPAVQDC